MGFRSQGPLVSNRHTACSKCGWITKPKLLSSIRCGWGIALVGRPEIWLAVTPLAFPCDVGLWCVIQARSLHSDLWVVKFLRVVMFLPSAIRPPRRNCLTQELEVEVGVPGPAGRLQILQLMLDRAGWNLSDDQLQAVTAVTHGTSLLSSATQESCLIRLPSPLLLAVF